MIKSTLVQIKGYSFYMEDIILVTGIEEDCQGKYYYFSIYLKGNIEVDLKHSNKDTLSILHTFLYNRKIRYTFQDKTMNIQDVDIERLIIYKAS